jgi:hypothetical protein
MLLLVRKEWGGGGCSCACTLLLCVPKAVAVFLLVALGWQLDLCVFCGQACFCARDKPVGVVLCLVERMTGSCSLALQQLSTLSRLALLPGAVQPGTT